MHPTNVATATIDVNNDGVPDYVVRGADLNNDGIPDVLQQRVVTMPAAQVTGPQVVRYGAQPTVYAGGAGAVYRSAAPTYGAYGAPISGGIMRDANHDGIPDVYQSRVVHSAAPVRTTVPAYGGIQGIGQQVHVAPTMAPTMSYAAPIAGQSYVANDLNRDGIPDIYQQQPVSRVIQHAPQPALDLNRDGIPDAFQRPPVVGHGYRTAMPMSAAPVMGAPMMGAPMMGAPMMGGQLPIQSPHMSAVTMPAAPVMGAQTNAPIMGYGAPVGTDLNRDGIPDQFQQPQIGGRMY